MKFTQDWFSQNIPNFEFVTKSIAPKRVLEIGVYEGRATCWMLQNMLPKVGAITCIDPFLEEGLYQRFRDNVFRLPQPVLDVELVNDFSWSALQRLIKAKRVFDFIYVDGSHETPDVLADAVLAWRLLAPGGIMLFDDYGGGAGVKPAVDSFIRCHRPELDVVISNYQVGVKKISDNPNDA